MNALDDIRRENMYILRSTVGGNVNNFVIKVKANRSTISSMFNGRKISDKYARLIEKAFGKVDGWLDTEHPIDEAIQYDRDVLQATISCIHSVKSISNLYARLEVEGKTDLFDKLYTLFTDPAAMDLSPSTLLTILRGATNGKEDTAKPKSNGRS